jgi:hypothetical protein
MPPRRPIREPAFHTTWSIHRAEDITNTSAASPDFNEKRHPYCGLLSSMHSWGLCNGRYGLSDKVLIDTISAQDRPLADRMLEGELKRQERLKAQLAKDPETAAWIEESHLFQNYKQLQFFDTLALYFNRSHEAARGEGRFEHVPMNVHEDATIAIHPVKPGFYALSPYPFAESPTEFKFSGRYIRRSECGAGTDWSAVFAAAPLKWERFRLIAG